MNSDPIRLYEQAPLLQVSGETIRPGGLALTDHALAFCALAAGSQVIDVGCGQGASVEHLITRHGMKAIGVDPSSMLTQAGKRRCSALPLIQAAGESLPFAAQTFDAVLMECTLSLMEADRALSEAARVLRQHGFLIVSDLYARDPDGAAALHDLPIRSCLTGAVSRTEITMRLTAHGFTVTLWEDHTDALKLFAARLIWEHGSLDQFWQCATHRERGELQTAAARSKPGYCLVIAQKS